MPSDIKTITDIHGNERRCGSLLVPLTFTSAFPVFETIQRELSDKEILQRAADNSRTDRRKLFGPSWIQNQGSKGSCNGYAIAGALAKARRLRGINDNLLLSGSHAYSLMNHGVDQGSTLEDGLRVAQQQGIAPASLVPWDMIFTHQMPANAAAEAAKHKGLCCYPVLTRQGFRTALALDYVVIVAVQAGTNFQTLNAAGVAFADNGPGNHAIHCDQIRIVGGVEVYDACNSWGLSYGQQGRALLTWASFSQSFSNHLFYAVASTEESE